jgi:glucose 1-dehydrogenase
MHFNNKTAIVTGAGQGIGFEICRQLALHGGNVLLNDIDENLALGATERIVGEKGICTSLAGDVSDVSFIKKMVDTAVEKFGGIDIVIANAGITLFGDFCSYTPETFYRVLQVNLGGSFFLAQAAANKMKQQGGG